MILSAAAVNLLRERKAMQKQFVFGMFLVFLVTMLGLIGLARAAAQAQPAPAQSDYKPTDVQRLEIKVAQQEVQLRYMEMQRANDVFQAAQAAYNEKIETVKKANNWPDNVTIDPRTLVFHAPAAPAKPTPAPAAAKP